MPAERLADQWEGVPVEHWRAAWAVPALYIFQCTPSTNDVVRQAGLAGAPAGTTAIAELQSGGRGRLGRPWTAPSGKALLLSTLLRPDSAGMPAAAGALPVRVGLALARALQQAAGISPRLKWPNDVLVGDGKLAGILCEARSDFVVVGIGINVWQQVADFPPELRESATSLRLATASVPARAQLAERVLAELQPLFTAPHRPLADPELARFASLDALAGRQVAIDGQPAGTAAGIDRLGALLVSTPDGLRTCHAGTVRPVP
jgi:BirA family biotin operon repressor/biotin-[acetyl-CoA-carboxylase] ligase